MEINSETRAFHNSICQLIKESTLPPVNIELVLSLILRDVSAMTNEEIVNEKQREAQEVEKVLLPTDQDIEPNFDHEFEQSLVKDLEQLEQSAAVENSDK